MNPFVLYLAAADLERHHGITSATDRRPSFASVDAPPLPEPPSVSRRERLSAIIRRRVTRVAGA